MATLNEILQILERTVAGADELYSFVGVASVITAGMILKGNDIAVPFDQTVGAHEKRLIWAREIAAQPRGASENVFYAVVAANSSAAQSAILNASDATIQGAIDSLADGFATAITETAKLATPSA